MNNEELIKEIREENERLKNELNLTKEHLHLFTFQIPTVRVKIT